MSEPDHRTIPTWLPVPEDDGAAGHLTGVRVPPLALPATDGTDVRLADLPGRSVVYVYPMMGRPGVALPAGWDMIPGARGCTAEACSFRDHFSDLQAAGAANVYGLSSQPAAEQREAADRLHLPFALVSDDGLDLADRIGLPTFTVGGVRRYRRLTMIVSGAVIETVFYPVFPPDRHPVEVIDWLRSNPRSAS